MTVLAADCSNYSSELTESGLAEWKAAGIKLVIAQAIDPPAGYPAGVTRQQCQAVLDAGLALDAYVYLWFGLDASDITRKLALLEGFDVRRIWLDVEDTNATAYSLPAKHESVREVLEVCDDWLEKHGSDDIQAGIYTGRWFWSDLRYMADSALFARRDLWDANYDGIATAEYGFVPYGGWNHAAIKQYDGSTSLAGISGIDMNALSEAEAAKLGLPDQTDDIDYGWQAKKPIVVGAAGELLSVADQITAEANRPAGPRKIVIRKLADGVRQRANVILN